jgi:hypothetical protein
VRLPQQPELPPPRRPQVQQQLEQVPQLLLQHRPQPVVPLPVVVHLQVDHQQVAHQPMPDASQKTLAAAKVKAKAKNQTKV